MQRGAGVHSQPFSHRTFRGIMDVLEVGGAKQILRTDKVVLFSGYKKQAVSSFPRPVIQTSHSSHLKLRRISIQVWRPSTTLTLGDKSRILCLRPPSPPPCHNQGTNGWRGKRHKTEQNTGTVTHIDNIPSSLLEVCLSLFTKPQSGSGGEELSG